LRAVGANKSRPPPSTAASNRSSLSPRRAPNLVVEWRYAGAPPFALTARDPFSPRSCLDPYPPSSPHPRPRLCECRSWDTPGFSPAHGRISLSPRGLPGHLHLARAAVSTPTPRPHVLARGPMSTDTSPSAHQLHSESAMDCRSPSQCDGVCRRTPPRPDEQHTPRDVGPAPGGHPPWSRVDSLMSSPLLWPPAAECAPQRRSHT
jgi:hypothetical protein